MTKFTSEPVWVVCSYASELQDVSSLHRELDDALERTRVDMWGAPIEHRHEERTEHMVIVRNGKGRMVWIIKAMELE